MENFLDKCIAGSDFNHQKLLEIGMATYTLQWKHPTSREYVAKVFLGGGKSRFDLGITRIIVSGETFAEFDATAVDEIRRGASPQEFSVYIKSFPRNFVVDIPVHPQCDGTGIEPGGVLCMPLSDRIRLCREHKRDVEFEIHPDGDMYRLSMIVRNQNIKMTYLVSPQEGYCVREFGMWSLKRADEPASREGVSTFQKLPNGAFIAESGTFVGRHRATPTSEAYVGQEYKFALKDFSTEPPYPSVFTFEGLGVPKGVRIQDRVQKN